jgi:hypothetical protein
MSRCFVDACCLVMFVVVNELEWTGTKIVRGASSDALIISINALSLASAALHLILCVSNCCVVFFCCVLLAGLLVVCVCVCVCVCCLC